ncbi:MAG: hypothetical protein U0636_07090 [Phycisphaerales bacterium]
MRRARGFRTQAVARMWEELRYAPAATLARMAADAEAFAADIQLEQAYPEELVLARITRYRPDVAQDSGVVVGQALLEDLVTFVERATARAPLARDLRGGALTLNEAASTLGVSRVTLGRYRQRGLMCHWADMPDGPQLVVFAEVLRDFAARHAALVQRAARTGRLTPDERAALATQAQAMLAEGGSTVQQVAEALAPQTGRSARTIRRALERGHGAGGGPVRDGAAHPRLTDDRARMVARAWQQGFAPQVLAPRLHVSVAACGRAVERGRLLCLRRAAAHARPLERPTFALPDAAATLLAPAAVRTSLPAGPWTLPRPQLASARASGARKQGGGAAQHGSAAGLGSELALLAAQHYLLWRVQRSVGQRARPQPAVLDSAERDLRWAYRLRRALVERALPDALARVAQHLGAPWASLPPELQWRWAACAIREMGHALDFHTLATVTLDEVHPTRAAALAVERLLLRGDVLHVVTSTPPHVHAATAAPWMAWLASGDAWHHCLLALEPQHALLVRRRFGLDGAPPATVEELAALLPAAVPMAQARLYAALGGVRIVARARAQQRD